MQGFRPVSPLYFFPLRNEIDHHPVDLPSRVNWRQIQMNAIIYLVGLVVVILAILSFFGLR